VGTELWLGTARGDRIAILPSNSRKWNGRSACAV